MDRWLTPREVDAKVVDLVARTRQEYGLPVGCSGAEACSRLGFELAFGRMPSGTDGLLSDGRIVVNMAVTWPPRIQFTIFHEITHHLLDEDGELIEFFTETLRNDERAFRAAIERCCNAGAAEFLMSRADVHALIATAGFSVGLIAQVAGRHGASPVAAALQLALCAPVDCYVVLAAHGPIPRAAPPRAGLYLEYAFASPGIKYPLARFTPVPPDHLLTTVWHEDTPAAGPSCIPFRSGRRMPCHGEATPLDRRVAGLLALQRPTPCAQLRLPLD